MRQSLAGKKWRYANQKSLILLIEHDIGESIKNVFGVFDMVL